MDIISEGQRVFDIEIDALKKMRDSLNETYAKIIQLIIECEGKVIITGMGKPGHIAAKIAATFSSLGTSSFYLHPAEAMHGDLGMISSKDIVIAISYSGESDEIVNILPNIKMIGALLIGVTGNSNSTLAKISDIVQVLPKFDEACYLGLAPTSSTTVELCYGDSLAVTASGLYGFKESDFGKLHPAGSLGKRLILTVDDLMAKGEDMPIVCEDTLLMDAIEEMTMKGVGVVSVVDDSRRLVGIFTDGDLRRIIEKRVDIYSEKIKNVMSKSPIVVSIGVLVFEAFRIIKENNINCLPVIDETGSVLGIITWQMIVKAGIVI